MPDAFWPWFCDGCGWCTADAIGEANCRGWPLACEELFWGSTGADRLFCGGVEEGLLVVVVLLLLLLLPLLSLVAEFAGDVCVSAAGDEVDDSSFERVCESFVRRLFSRPPRVGIEYGIPAGR